MLTKFIPFAVLISAPLLANATPLVLGGGATVTATLTVYQCPTSSPAPPSSSAPARSSSVVVVSSSAAASFPSAPATNTVIPNLLTGLDQLLSSLNTATGLVPSLLNIVGSLPSALNQLGGFLSGLTGQINGLQTGVNNLATNIDGLTTQFGNLNTLVNGIVGNAVSAANANQLYIAGNNTFTQIISLGNQINSLATAIQSSPLQNSGSNVNVAPLVTKLQTLIQQLSVFGPALSNQCAQKAALNTAYQATQTVLGGCIINLNKCQ
ncbi:hypothetical protein K438DRAFT_1755039 [Mycena galopus ATCC 62051]|nr:hypothetical protein K438DRAFT_1755039 [Mycena galopus ATCC 62051]